MEEFTGCVTPSKIKLNRVYTLKHSYSGNTIGKEDNLSYVIVKSFNKHRFFIYKADGTSFTLRRGQVDSLLIPASTRRIRWGLYEVPVETHVKLKRRNRGLFKPFIRFIPIKQLTQGIQYSYMSFDQVKAKFIWEDLVEFEDDNPFNRTSIYLTSVVPDTSFSGRNTLAPETSGYGVSYGLRYQLK